ncbi:MAG: sigma-70 domain-containing protein, partial [Pirellulaceae bacterium]
IRQAIQRGVAGSERTIRLPVALHDALVKVRAAAARIESETGREPTVEELASATKLSSALSRGRLRSTLPTARSSVSGQFVAANVNHHGTSPWHPCGLLCPGRMAAPVRIPKRRTKRR